MGKPLIMVSSITYAMKARDLLINNGIAAKIAINIPIKCVIALPGSLICCFLVIISRLLENENLHM